MSDGHEYSLEHEMEKWDYFHKDESKGITEDALQQLHEDERAALRRVAAGVATTTDAVLLAGSLGHADLFIPQEPTIYGYMGEER